MELGDLRENSEYKAALERQQFVQARLGQLHQRLNQLSQLANTEAPTDRVGLGSRVTVLDLETNETDTYVVVLAEMMDIDAGTSRWPRLWAVPWRRERWARRSRSGSPPPSGSCASSIW